MAKINEEVGKVGFGRAIINFFKGYVDFMGKSTRASYWWMQLFWFIIFLPLLFLWAIVQALIIGNLANLSNLMPGLTASATFSFNPILFVIVLVSLAIFIPTYALLARRFRDVGISNQWIFIVLAASLLLVVVSLIFHESVRPNSLFYAVKFFIFMLNFGLGVTFFVFSLLPSNYLKNDKKKEKELPENLSNFSL